MKLDETCLSGHDNIADIDLWAYYASGYTSVSLAPPTRKGGSSLHLSLRAADFKESVMLYWALSATAAGAAILISSSGSANSPYGQISGNYFLNVERSDNYLQSINSALPVSSLATRDLVRRLRKAAAPGYAISISFPEERVSIRMDDKRLIDVSTNGEAIEWKLVDGLIFDVSATANDEAVSLTFRAPDSERTTVYRSDGQQLVAETTITGPLISTPIRYKVVYNRAN